MTKLEERITNDMLYYEQLFKDEQRFPDWDTRYDFEKVFDKLDNQMIQCFTKIKELDTDIYNWRRLCYQYSIQNIYKIYSKITNEIF